MRSALKVRWSCRIGLAVCFALALSVNSQAEDSAIAEVPTETYLGVFTAPLPPAMANQLAEVVPEGNGLLILAIVPGSPAKEAGLQQHDVLLKFDRTSIRSVTELSERIRARRMGDEVPLEIVRRSRRQRIDVRLAERPQTPPLQAPGYRVVASASGTRIANVPGAGNSASKEDVLLVEKNGRQKLNAAKSLPDERPLEGALVLVCRNEREFEANWKPSRRETSSPERRAHGVKSEFLREINDWPAALRTVVISSMERLREHPKEQKATRAMQVRVLPCRDGESRGVRLELQTQPDAETLRLFQLHHQFAPGEAMNMADLMKSPALAKELESQEPAIRKHVEEALRRAAIPEVRIHVKTSQ